MNWPTLVLKSCFYNNNDWAKKGDELLHLKKVPKKYSIQDFQLLFRDQLDICQDECNTLNVLTSVEHGTVNVTFILPTYM